jgi:uncharacterized RDD family membrane protein YckC
LPAPEQLTIDTPEQISLEYPLASAGSRFLALAIDTLIQLAIFVALVALALGGLALERAIGSSAVIWIEAALLVIGFTVYYGYFAAFEARWNGQTPGKRIIGLRVIAASGRPITTLDAILRNLLRIVDQLPGIYAVGIISIFLTSRNQRLGDLAAGTVVVHEAAAPLHPAAPATLPGARLGATRLLPHEIEAIEVFLNRRDALPLSRRDRTASELAAYVRERVTLPAGAELSDEALLEAVIAEYRAGK